MDTPLVNGTVYPYMEVEPKTYRLPRPECLQRPVREPPALQGRPGHPDRGRRPPSTPRSGWCPRSWDPDSRRLADGRTGGRRPRSHDGGTVVHPDRHGRRLPAGARASSATSPSAGT
ncbi:MAG: hypothetical protein MZU84_08355 [Sphingobacterium sp.]|nr:hypothetical protein [Sphingobacterium sp.]